MNIKEFTIWLEGYLRVDLDEEERIDIEDKVRCIEEEKTEPCINPDLERTPIWELGKIPPYYEYAEIQPISGEFKCSQEDLEYMHALYFPSKETK